MPKHERVGTSCRTYKRLPLKGMELEDVLSDLQAIRKLYGLLQRSADNMLIATSELLDDRARLILKCLLDAAMEMVMEAHSKSIAATQSRVSNTASYSGPVQSKAAIMLQSPNSPNISNACSSSSGNLKKDLTSHPLTASKVKQSLDKQIPPELSRMDISSNKFDSRKKGCRVCKESHVKQLNSGKIPSKEGSVGPGPHNEAPSPFILDSEHLSRLSQPTKKGTDSYKNDGNPNRKRVCELQCNVSTVSSVAWSSSSLAESVVRSQTGCNPADQTKKKIEAASNDFSKEVTNAIQRIESQISTLQLCSEGVGATSDLAVHCSLSSMPTSLTPVSEMRQVSEVGHPVDYALPKRQTSQLNLNEIHQVVSQIQIDSPTQTRSHKERIEPEHKKNLNSIMKSHELLRQRQNLKAPELNTWASQTMVERIDSMRQSSPYVRGLRVPGDRDDRAGRPPLPLKMPRQLRTDHKNHRKVEKSRPSVPYKSESHIGPDWPVQNKSMPHQMIMKPTLLDQEFQAGNEDQKDIKNAVPRTKLLQIQQKPYHRTASSTSPCSTSCASEQTGISSSESDSDGNAYSLPSQTPAQEHATQLSSSEESNSSYSTRSGAKDSGPPTAYRPGRRKSIGPLRRLKNKLGLIFHHHHHHHHHHHYAGFTWKHLRKIFYRESKHEAHEKQGFDKLRKSAVSNSPREQHAGHFHALVEGLTRHIRLTKKPKRPKRGVSKKQRWWHMFKRRRGLKLPKKGRLKLGVTTRKPRLRAA